MAYGAFLRGSADINPHVDCYAVTQFKSPAIQCAARNAERSSRSNGLEINSMTYVLRLRYVNFILTATVKNPNPRKTSKDGAGKFILLYKLESKSAKS